jgi:hypothetical protein
MRLGTALVSCCSLLALLGAQGCSVLLDTKSLTDGDTATGAVGDLPGGSAAGGATSVTPLGGSPSGGAATAGSLGSGAAGGGMAGASVTAAGAGAVGGDPSGGGTTTCSSDAVELCDGLDNDCDPATPDNCPHNCLGVAHGNGSYMVCNLEVGFAEAEVVCEDFQMRLVKIDDVSENSFVRSLAKVSSPYVWIGASDPGGNGVYEWVDGTVMYDNGSAVRGVYENFLSGQPQQLTKKACAQMEVRSGGWSNTPCSDTQQFVCESY